MLVIILPGRGWSAAFTKIYIYGVNQNKLHMLPDFAQKTLFLQKYPRMKKLSMEELNRLTTEEFRRAAKMPVTVVLDDIRSQHNIGSVFRTADAFRVEAIHLCGITATPPHREIQKSALGATESVSWVYYSDTIDAVNRLRDEGYSIVVVEQTDESVPPEEIVFTGDQKIALIFGNEVKGVRQEIVDIADVCVEIPQMGTKHSLNVSVSAGIILWTLFSRMDWN